MISFLISIAISVLRLASFILLIYCVMSIFMPQNKFFRMAAEYVDPILAPFRGLIYRVFPKIRNFGMDFSPLLVWVVIDVLIWLLQLLRRIF